MWFSILINGCRNRFASLCSRCPYRPNRAATNPRSPRPRASRRSRVLGRGGGGGGVWMGFHTCGPGLHCGIGCHGRGSRRRTSRCTGGLCTGGCWKRGDGPGQRCATRQLPPPLGMGAASVTTGTSVPETLRKAARVTTDRERFKASNLLVIIKFFQCMSLKNKLKAQQMTKHLVLLASSSIRYIGRNS